MAHADRKVVWLHPVWYCDPELNFGLPNSRPRSGRPRPKSLPRLRRTMSDPYHLALQGPEDGQHIVARG